MPKRIRVEPYLTIDELEERYRRAKEPVERSHLQIVWLLAQGKATREVVQSTGYCAEWIQTIARRYNQRGPSGLGDRRKGLPGQKPLLDKSQQEELYELLRGPAPDGGLWTGPKVAKWISEKIGREVGKQRGWDYLKRLGFSVQTPRPRHAEADRGAGGV
jgi:transposase